MKLIPLILTLLISLKTNGQYFDNYENALLEPEKVERLSLNYKNGNPGVLDERVKSLINLKKIYIQNCTEKELVLPLEITQLPKLEYFQINELKETKDLPDNLFKIKSLKTLDLHSSQLIEIPNEIGDLNNLEYLMIHCRPLSTLNPSIFNISSLKSIQITSDKLQHIPDRLGQLTNLNRLTLHCASLLELPVTINKLEKLKYIDIYSKENFFIPKDLSNLKSVTEFRWGQAQRFPEEILQLENLKKITFDVSYFKSFPEGLGRLQNVEIISMTISVFDSIPDEITNMNSLLQLDLRSSSFTYIPESISQMKSLKGIDMKYNEKFSDFDSLIQAVKNSTSIEWINIEGTKYTDEIIAKMKKELVDVEIIYEYFD